MRSRKKKWAEPFLNQHSEIAIFSVKDAGDFLSFSPLFLEIGIGKGDFIIDRSQKEAGRFLGLERDISIAGIAARKALEAGRDNIRIMPCDFDFAYEELAALRFKKIFLNFSDPWPKRKHWKRRLTTPDRLSKMASMLERDGKIIVKTDQRCLYEFTLESAKSANLIVESQSEQYAFDENSDSMSEYESLFRSQGNNIYRIVIKKGEEHV